MIVRRIYNFARSDVLGAFESSVRGIRYHLGFVAVCAGPHRSYDWYMSADKRYIQTLELIALRCLLSASAIRPRQTGVHHLGVCLVRFWMNSWICLFEELRRVESCCMEVFELRITVHIKTLTIPKYFRQTKNCTSLGTKWSRLSTCPTHFVSSYCNFLF